MALGIKSALDLRSVAKTREDFKKQLQDLQKYADNNVIKIKIDNATNNINKIGSQVKAVGDSARNASDGFKTLGSSMGTIGGFYTRWLGVTQLINSSINAIKSGIQEIKSIDDSNVRIAMITGDTVENVKKMNGEIMGVSKNLGSLYSETANGMESWMRSGVDKNEALKNLETTTKLAKIAGEDNKGMADSLIIVKNAYDLNSTALEGYASRVALLDNQSATSSMKINKAMQYSAQTFKGMGVDMDTALSWITNFSEKSAQSGESIGRNFRSMMLNFTKMQEGVKDGNGDEIDAVNKLEGLLSSKGIALRKNKDEWRDLGIVMKEIQSNMGKFTDVEKSELAWRMGGKEQSELALATINNMKRIDELNGKLKSDNGAVALNESYSKSIDSIDFKFNNLKNTATEMWMKLIDSNTIKTTIDGLTSIINAITNLDGKTVLAGIAFVTTIKLMSASMKTFTVISSFTKAGQAVGLFQKMMVAMRVESAIASLSMGTMASGAVGLGAGFRVLGASIMTSVKASIAFMMTPLGAVLGALTVVIGIVTYAFAKNAKAQAEMKARVDENKASVEGLTQSLKTMDEEGIKSNSKPLIDKQKSLKDDLAEKKRILSEMDALKSKGVSTESTNNYVNDYTKDQKALMALQGQYKDTEKSINSMTAELKQSGLAFNEQTGSIDQAVQAQQALQQIDMLSKFEQEAQSIVNNQDELRSLYAEYQTLSKMENQSADDKARLSEVTNYLNQHYGNLTIQIDENGDAMTGNIGMINNVIGALDAEGNTVVNVAKAQRDSMESMVQVEINGTQSTIAQIKARMTARQAEMNLKKSSGNFEHYMYSPTSKSAKEDKAYYDWEMAYNESMAKIGAIPQATNMPNRDTSYIPSGVDKPDKAKKEKEAKKDVANMEGISDRYFKLNNAIKQVENSLNALNTAKENANDEKKLKLLDREIDLLKQKAQAQQNLVNEKDKERIEIKSGLYNDNFTFDSKGQATNAKQRLDDLANYANSLSGDAKETMIARVKAIGENVTKYNDLLNEQIPKTLNDIQSLKDSEISARKSIADIIKKQISEEKSLRLKLIDDVKEKYQKENSDSDKKEELNKEKKALEELQTLRISKLRDTSRLGAMMLRDLDNSISEQEKKITDMVKTNAREEQNSLLDEQKKKIEENSENAVKKLDSDAIILGKTLETNLLDIFKKANLETDSIVSKFKSMNFSVFNEQGKKEISSPQMMTYKANDVSKGVSSSTINNSNQSPITISMPITVNGKPTDSEYKEIENKFGTMIKKGVDILREELYQKNLRYGN